MNVLLTSVGRRSYLVDYFKRALDGSGIVVGANSVADTAGMLAVDKAYVVPLVNSDEYIPELLKICQQHDIKLLVSLFDIDLPYLAKAKSQFEQIGVCVVVSDPAVIDIANDKWHTFEFLRQYDFPTPLTFCQQESFEKAAFDGEIIFPVIVKPRWGMGSIAVYKAEDLTEARFFISYVKKQIAQSCLNILSNQQLEEAVLIQQYIEGDEYGVDVFHDLEERHLVTVVKRKLAMRSGETDGAEVVDFPLVNEAATELGGALGHIGNLDIDILFDSKTQQHYVLEFNARLGGGYPFSHLAGVDFPRMLLKMVENELIDKSLVSYRTGVTGLKFIEPRLV